RVTKEVLAVDFDEADRWPALGELGVMRRPRPDADRGRGRALDHHRPLLLLRLARVGARGGLTAHLLAGSLRHVLPFVGSVVLRRLARAGVARGGAVVLSRLHDPVALLRRPLRTLCLCGLREAEGE